MTAIYVCKADEDFCIRKRCKTQCKLRGLPYLDLIFIKRAQLETTLKAGQLITKIAIRV